MVRVAVGTSNPLKVMSVEKVFPLFMDIEEVVPISVQEPVRQPVGARSLARGALKRAITAIEKAKSDYGVGIEAGPIEFYSTTGFVETQVAAIVNSYGEVSFGLSPSFELPGDVIELMIRGVELSEAFAPYSRRSGDIGESIGVVGILTQGNMTRLDLTVAALMMALIPHVHKDRYRLARVADILSRLGEASI